MPQKRTNKSNSDLKKVEKLLNQQTAVILSAVDEKLKINKIDILVGVDQKLVKMETRINQKIDKLITTLDKFLKRLTNIEDEIEIIKLDINRLKKVIREKLGVNLS
ncbi:MAG: hypothetical protein QME57_03815 [Patescibacteria group bacterium]|nr:hypothetical protein [Patescibacteria group bacterium]